MLNIMKRFRLPLWHAVCHPSLFWKVRSATCHCSAPLRGAGAHVVITGMLVDTSQGV